MTEGVKEQEAANPGTVVKPQQSGSDKELNFRRLEAAKEEERERRVKAELETALLKQRLDDIERRQQPAETDPLDGVEDYVDPKSLRAALSQQERRLKKEAEVIANRIVEDRKHKDKKENHMSDLRKNYTDYDQVMTNDNVLFLEENYPELCRPILRIEDDYERKESAYSCIKKLSPKKENIQQAIKEKVQENSTNPYYIPSSQGTPPGAVDFDVSSPKARDAAYKKLKDAQRRGIAGRSSS